MNISCKACHKEIKLFSKYNNLEKRDTHFSTDLRVATCSDCGFSFLLGVDSKALNQFYQASYRRSSGRNSLQYSQGKKKLILNFRAIACLLLAEKYIDFYSEDILLDFGSGNGQLLDAAKLILSAKNFIVIEKHKEGYEFFLNNYDAKCFDDISSVNGKIKIMTFIHVLEHLSFDMCTSILKQSALLLDPSGVIVIEVPNDDFRYRLSNKIDDYPHVLFFSIRSIKKIIESCNLDILFINGVGRDLYNLHARNYFYNSLIRLIIKLLIKLNKNKLSNIAKFLIKLNYNFQYGENLECIRIVAKRRAGQENENIT